MVSAEKYCICCDRFVCVEADGTTATIRRFDELSEHCTEDNRACAVWTLFSEIRKMGRIIAGDKELKAMEH